MVDTSTDRRRLADRRPPRGRGWSTSRTIPTTDAAGGRGRGAEDGRHVDRSPPPSMGGFLARAAMQTPGHVTPAGARIRRRPTPFRRSPTRRTTSMSTTPPAARQRACRAPASGPVSAARPRQTHRASCRAIDPASAGWEWTTFHAYRLVPGQAVSAPADDKERLVHRPRGPCLASARAIWTVASSARACRSSMARRRRSCSSSPAARSRSSRRRKPSWRSPRRPAARFGAQRSSVPRTSSSRTAAPAARRAGSATCCPRRRRPAASSRSRRSRRAATGRATRPQARHGGPARKPSWRSSTTTDSPSPRASPLPASTRPTAASTRP